MKATFHLAADFEIHIEPFEGNVNVLLVDGVWYDGNDTRTMRTISLPKAEARAIASAMMGCAAQL